jgi:hypothetical protein
MKLTITNAKSIDCSMGFPPAALSVRLRIFDIVPATLVEAIATIDALWGR